MSIKESVLQEQLHRAMKDRDATRVSVLRGVIAGIKNAKVEQRVQELPGDQIAAVVRRELKKCDEAMEFARQGRRDDVLRQNEAERAILSVLLPALLTPEETEDTIRRFCAEGASGIGDIMKRLQAEFPGRIDGKRASEIAKRVLAEAR